MYRPYSQHTSPFFDRWRCIIPRYTVVPKCDKDERVHGRMDLHHHTQDSTQSAKIIKKSSINRLLLETLVFFYPDTHGGAL